MFVSICCLIEKKMVQDKFEGGSALFPEFSQTFLLREILSKSALAENAGMLSNVCRGLNWAKKEVLFPANLSVYIHGICSVYSLSIKWRALQQEALLVTSSTNSVTLTAVNDGLITLENSVSVSNV